MARTEIYKNQNTLRSRVCTTEDVFDKGVKTTNAPLDSGYVKHMVNFDLKNEGTVLRPRPAYEKTFSSGSSDTYSDNIVASGITEVQGFTEDSGYTVHSFAFISGWSKTLFPDRKENALVDTQSIGESLFSYVDQCAKVLLECPGKTPENIIATYDATKNTLPAYKILRRENTQDVHDMHSFISTPREAITSRQLANNYFMLQHQTTNKYELGRLVVKFQNEEGTSATWWMELVTPREVLPSQAINYGYNMLSEAPYTFNNVQTAQSKVQLMGLLPYNSDTDALVLSAKLGTPIKFKLFYKYPAADVANTNERYYTSWELYDLENTSAVTNLLQDITVSPVIVPGQEISYTFTPSVKSFGLIVTLYRLSNINPSNTAVNTTAELKALIDAKNGAYIPPEQTITLASYYLTNEDNNNKASALDLVKYNLQAARGMCTWQQRIVLWGVPKAQSVLFVSDVNSPDYFPYPNNCEIFDGEIVNCVPYLDKLLVFTKTALYMLAFTASLSSYTTTKVQDRLVINEDDVNTMLSVLNMVYFKSGNYYYMVVPKTQSLTGELQLAPISRPIEQFLDNFKKNVYDIIRTVYNLDIELYDLDFVDNYSYLSNNQIRNVYKFKTYITEDVYGETENVVKFFNFTLLYDVTLRSWTIHVHDAWASKEYLYKNTTTGYVVLATCINSQIVLITEDSTKCADTHLNQTEVVPLFRNYQYIDTGFRKHSEQMKKRYREIQFFVNSLTNKPIQFHTAFHADSEERLSFYKNVVDYVEDPTDPAYGTITVVRELQDPQQTPGLTYLGYPDEYDPETDNTAGDPWVLDASRFPDLSLYKIRFLVSGKSYGGRVQILCMSEDLFELLNINWVYKVMFAR